jgi:tripartite ATP-independent transporter DctM subunit
MGFSLMLFIVYLVKSGREKCPITPRASLKSIWLAFRNSFFALISPGVILWCLVSGVVTPTEAGVIATIYSIVVGLLYGDFKLRDIPEVLIESMRLTALIMFIIAMATIMGHVMTMEQTPQLISKYMLQLTDNKIILLLLINIFLLFLGSILEGMPILIIMIPILLPLVTAIGVDVVHFGIIMCFNVVLGIITPPMAIGIVILVGISGSSFESIAQTSLKFLIPLIGALLIITFIPQLTLFLPRLLLGP